MYLNFYKPRLARAPTKHYNAPWQAASRRFREAA